MKKRRDKEYVERMKNIGEFCLEINSIEDVQSIWIVINERMDFQGLGIAREIRDSTYPTICQHPIRTVNLYVFGHDLNPSRDVWRGCRLKRINVCQPSFRRMDVHVCLDMCVYTRVSIGNAFLDCNLRWWFLFVRSLNKIGGGDKQFLNVKDFFSIEKLGINNWWNGDNNGKVYDFLLNIYNKESRYE